MFSLENLERNVEPACQRIRPCAEERRGGEIESIYGQDELVRRPGGGERIFIFDDAVTRRGTAHGMP